MGVAMKRGTRNYVGVIFQCGAYVGAAHKLVWAYFGAVQYKSFSLVLEGIALQQWGMLCGQPLISLLAMIIKAFGAYYRLRKQL